MKNKCGKPLACLSPCKKWNYPEPFGYGLDEKQDLGRQFCCPEGVSIEECQQGIVLHTQYIQLISHACPTAYSYSYDDNRGLHKCPSSTSFDVTFYSEKNQQPFKC